MIKINSSFLVNYIQDVSKTADFWKTLGFTIKKQEEDKVVVPISNTEIHYILETTEPFDEYQFATNRDDRGMGVLIYFEVEDIEIFYSQVKNLSPQKITKPKQNLWGAKEFLFSDPDRFLFVAYQSV